MEDVAYTQADFLEVTLDKVSEQRNQALDDLAASLAREQLSQKELDLLRSDYQALATDYYELWAGDTLDRLLDKIAELEDIVELQELHIASVTNELAVIRAENADLKTPAELPPEPQLLLEDQQTVPIGEVIESIIAQPEVNIEMGLPFVPGRIPPLTPLVETLLPVIEEISKQPSIDIENVHQEGANAFLQLLESVPNADPDEEVHEDLVAVPQEPEKPAESLDEIVESLTPAITIDVGDVAQDLPERDTTREQPPKAVDEIAPLVDNDNPLLKE